MTSLHSTSPTSGPGGLKFSSRVNIFRNQSIIRISNILHIDEIKSNIESFRKPPVTLKITKYCCPVLFRFFFVLHVVEKTEAFRLLFLTATRIHSSPKPD